MTLNKTLTGETDSHIHWLSETIGIHHQVVKPWQALVKAAQEQGFNLSIASGFRSFERQLSIWDRKFSGQLPLKDRNNNLVAHQGLSEQSLIEHILIYTALPATSRHHWGTDIDIFDPKLLSEGQNLQLEPWEYQKYGPFESLAKWLNLHAAKFGFYFPYDQDRGGVAIEPWHLSYQPLAKHFSQQLTAELVYNCLDNSAILGKSYLLKHIDVIFTQYVNNIGEFPHG